jgi:hypothetical protein
MWPSFGEFPFEFSPPGSVSSDRIIARVENRSREFDLGLISSIGALHEIFITPTG